MRVPAQSLAASRTLQAPTPGRLRSVGAPGTDAAPGAVQLSSAGSLVIGLRADASRTAVRPDVVARIRADLASGSIGSAADLDATVDALLLELA